MSALLRAAPLVVALWGWACLALAVASQGLVVALAGVGFLASTLARRFAVGSAVVELLALGALAGGGGARWSFVVVGAVLVVAARAVSEVGRRADR